ncbi:MULTISPECIES: DivIVA domain-containing protein [Tepidanaerobacter]|uniref:Cell division initiation protein n=1 Tax=Tepidanaerobacter syntrophicus TaxID=224999 RepID=A0A0U9HQ78_9FIRM|nr:MULTISPECIES: DivIVA domain-containing protein [Tepidanaerobacter]GAQ26049.1 cell division initiation protein [Tepidanaerobacter syntrophicus]GLI19636.1 cell division protein DivIVA [Tepidanaerobacter syntrophicus]GLI50337.1 cell division protein DivIVA [Tepidanaerobacter syntrophicus]HHV82364.1 DivIVA domain-containing protein [Tepidanaerobacter syntrophicus]
MDLSPLEIQKKEFSKSMRGYNKEEVDEFLEKLTENYEKIYKENKDLRERIELLEETIQSYREIETTLKNTLVLAEQTAEEVKANARKEREIILKQANAEADKIIEGAQKKFNQINNKTEELLRQFNLYKTRFKNFLQSQLDYLDCSELDISNLILQNQDISQEENVCEASKTCITETSDEIAVSEDTATE